MPDILALPDAVTVVDLMGLAFVLAGLLVAVASNVAALPRLTEEERELLAGASLCLAILGTAFVVAE